MSDFHLRQRIHDGGNEEAILIEGWEIIMLSSLSCTNIRCDDISNSCPSPTIRISNHCQGYDELANLSRIVDVFTHNCVVIDLTEVQQMTIIAFARLVAIKRRLRTTGRQMLVQGLQQQPRALCDLLKLSSVLLEKPD